LLGAGDIFFRFLPASPGFQSFLGHGTPPI
jgi:hypothetical protein